MRLSTITKFRRARPAAAERRHFLCYYSSSYSSHSLINSSHHHHRDDRRNYSPRRSSVLYWHSSLDCSSSPRRFSAQSGAFEPGERFLPVQTLIYLLDSYHDVTGLPWWIIICSSTVAMRLAIFPLIVLQLKKLRMIGELLPKLPPPIPPPLSGRSFRDQFALFWMEKEAARCPSVLWFFSSVAVQVPCFFLWLMTIRKMSLDHHPGFDMGGILWSLNLTEYPHGALGPIFPLCIAGLHFANVQLSLRNSSLQHVPGTLKLLAKIYKVYLQLLTLPILIATFYVPQGSLIYWFTNSTFSLIQLLCLHNPNVREYLGLSEMNASAVSPTVIQREHSSLAAYTVIRTKEGEMSAETLSPEDLVSLSIQVLSGGQKDGAIALLRVALDKDPGHVRAWLIMGQTLLQKEHYAEAAECLDKAISMLLVAGNPTGVEEVDLLILSSQWAGTANMLQGKTEEGLVHLERIAQMKEPQDSKSKAHYYDGLIILSSALVSVNRRAEAFKYLHKAAAYNPAFYGYIEQLEAEVRGFASDLSNSNRYL
ncbi:ALBINO3-like protein 2, chloroplastic isoform X2 [Salvia miltiorrhiza]|uniref:ALBINO3-like protein 2, chloroplastic isoform X2 n=1 Tax=Salvia miltiorrhiza TaxID=226208 RepID=UPI0025AC9A22|nr:ALBINO3-like protein 2, chloroplastic isoform X2 [Salvia miltiorrhiza]